MKMTLLTLPSRTVLGCSLLTCIILFTAHAAPPNPPPGQPFQDEGDRGNGNTAEGKGALFSLTTGANNTAMGFDALYSLTSSNGNTALGDHALYTMTDAAKFGLGVNTAIGANALQNNTTGFFNTATGHAALASNTTGFRNTADGKGALNLNTTGAGNVATGNAALVNNTTGSNNIALGFFAGDNLTTGDNNIDIANIGVAGEANTIRVGTEVTVTDQFGIVHPAHTAAFIAGISGTPVVGDAVVVDANGQLGTVASSRRFKDEIKPMEKTSEAILSLRPVTFRYKKEIDPKNTPQFGLVAEEVEKVDPDLVARDANGKAYTVRYEAVNAMLLNEFLKEHRQVQEQQKQIDQLTAQLKEQAELIHRVSARVELNESRAQTVAENQ